MRHGRGVSGSPEGLKQLSRIVDGFGEVCEGTQGLAAQYDPGLALNLTQRLVQNGWDDTRITHEHLNASKMGFLWVRRQEDPEAASAALIAKCDKTKRPIIPMKHRHAKIVRMLATGEIVSQKQLVAFVGTARDSDTRNDLERLEQAGAISIERVQHGKVTWRSISLAVTVRQFWGISRVIRKGIAKEITDRIKDEWAEKRGRSKRVQRTPVVAQAEPDTEAQEPLDELEDDLIDLANTPKPGCYPKKRKPISRWVENKLLEIRVAVQEAQHAHGGGDYFLAVMRGIRAQGLEHHEVVDTISRAVKRERPDLPTDARAEHIAERLAHIAGIDPAQYVKVEPTPEPEEPRMTFEEMEAAITYVAAQHKVEPTPEPHSPPPTLEELLMSL